MDIKIEQRAEIERAMRLSPDFERRVRKIIASAVIKARRTIMSAFKAHVKSDPRNTAAAVKISIYKKALGANISEYGRSRASGKTTTYVRPRKLDANPHQRGGNRMPRKSDVTKRIDSYDGIDRAFVLRWLAGNGGERASQIRRTGKIGKKFVFADVANPAMEAAAEEVNAALAEELKRLNS